MTAAKPQNGKREFGGFDEYPVVVEWDRMELLKRERAALGCYVSGHPLFRYQSKLPRIGAIGTLDLAGQQAWSAVSVAGMVEDYQERLFKGGSGGAPRSSKSKTNSGACQPR